MDPKFRRRIHTSPPPACGKRRKRVKAKRGDVVLTHRRRAERVCEREARDNTRAARNSATSSSRMAEAEERPSADVVSAVQTASAIALAEKMRAEGKTKGPTKDGKKLSKAEEKQLALRAAIKMVSAFVSYTTAPYFAPRSCGDPPPPRLSAHRSPIHGQLRKPRPTLPTDTSTPTIECDATTFRRTSM